MRMLDHVAIFALAANAALTLWFHSDSFLVSWRARVELWENWLGNLLGCRLCMSYQVPFWFLVLPFYLPSFFLEEPWNQVVLIPVFTLAVTTSVWIISGVISYLEPYFSTTAVEPVEELPEKEKELMDLKSCGAATISKQEDFDVRTESRPPQSGPIS